MEEERTAVSLDVYKQAEEENECVDVDNKDIVSMELESSVTQGTELHYLHEEPYWRDEKANVVVQPLPKQKYGNDMELFGPYLTHRWEWYGKVRW